MQLRNAITGTRATYGTTAVLAPSVGGPLGVTARAEDDNTGKVYFGGSNVASDGSNAYGFLKAGEAYKFAVGNLASAGIYFVGSAAGQDVLYVGSA